MGKIVVVASLILAPSRASAPQDPADLGQITTNGVLNCRGWRAVSGDQTAAVMYLSGLNDGFTVGTIREIGTARGSTDGPRNMQDIVDGLDWFNGAVSGRAPNLRRDERVKALHAFCAVPENSSVQVPDAYRLVGMKAAGALPDQLELEVAKARQKAAALVR